MAFNGLIAQKSPAAARNYLETLQGSVALLFPAELRSWRFNEASWLASITNNINKLHMAVDIDVHNISFTMF